MNACPKKSTTNLEESEKKKNTPWNANPPMQQLQLELEKSNPQLKQQKNNTTCNRNKRLLYSLNCWREDDDEADDDDYEHDDDDDYEHDDDDDYEEVDENDDDNDYEEEDNDYEEEDDDDDYEEEEEEKEDDEEEGL